MSYPGHNLNGGNGYHGGRYAPEQTEGAGAYDGDVNAEYDDEMFDDRYDESTPPPSQSQTAQYAEYYGHQQYPAANGYTDAYPYTSSTSLYSSYSASARSGPLRESSGHQHGPLTASREAPAPTPTSRRARIPTRPKDTTKYPCPERTCGWGYDKKSDFNRHRKTHEAPSQVWYCVHVGCNRSLWAQPPYPFHHRYQCTDHIEKHCRYGRTSAAMYGQTLAGLEMDTWLEL